MVLFQGRKRAILSRRHLQLHVRRLIHAVSELASATVVVIDVVVIKGVIEVLGVLALLHQHRQHVDEVELLIYLLHRVLAKELKFRRIGDPVCIIHGHAHAQGANL
mmetsp:Transcript_1351/g.3304  ORF Transcript_1351/g.3304 Transcript_1351/m.3304 type:complete len:106 (+) Transcript_1351:34-351(+)